MLEKLLAKVRRKRARMIVRLMILANAVEDGTISGNTPLVMQSGNLHMRFIPGRSGGDDWVWVSFRGTVIAGINVVVFSVLNYDTNPHSNTDATRYQIKQLQEACKEITTALAALPVEVGEGETARFTFEATQPGPAKLVKAQVIPAHQAPKITWEGN